MGLKMTHRKAVTSEAAKRYRTASKKQKSRILDEHVALTGRNRSPELAAALLGYHGGRAPRRRGGQDRGRPAPPPAPQPPRLRRAGRGGAEEGLVIAANAGGGPACGAGEVWRTLLGPRHAPEAAHRCIDRLLRTEERARDTLHTKPTTRLMNEIPIRTFTEWQERPGEVGADLVGHDGGITGGEHAFTLVLTDRVTQWTEVRAVLNKAQKWVFQALLLIRSWLPFAVRPAHRQRLVHQPRAPLRQERIELFAPQPQERQQSPSRRTTTWCAATSATCACRPSRRSSCSTSSTIGCGAGQGSSSPRPGRAGAAVRRLGCPEVSEDRKDRLRRNSTAALYRISC